MSTAQSGKASPSRSKKFLLTALASLLGLAMVAVLLVVFGLAMAYPLSLIHISEPTRPY